jgi:hypothetical protein
MTTKTRLITLQHFINETGECPDEAIYKDRHGQCVVSIDGISETPFRVAGVHYVRLHGQSEPVPASKLFVKCYEMT